MNNARALNQARGKLFLLQLIINSLLYNVLEIGWFCGILMCGWVVYIYVNNLNCNTCLSLIFDLKLENKNEFYPPGFALP